MYLRVGREETRLNYERMTFIGFLATVGGLIGIFYNGFLLGKSVYRLLQTLMVFELLKRFMRDNMSGKSKN